MIGQGQLSLDYTPDPVAAQAARDDGIARSDANTSAAWKAEAKMALRWCAERMDTFTADDVWQRLTDVGVTGPHEPAALGPVMLWGSRGGIIAKTNEVRPTVFRRRHRDLTVWRSLVVR